MFVRCVPSLEIGQATAVMFSSATSGSGAVKLSAADIEAIISQGGVPQVTLRPDQVVGVSLVDVAVAAKLTGSKGACV